MPAADPVFPFRFPVEGEAQGEGEPETPAADDPEVGERRPATRAAVTRAAVTRAAVTRGLTPDAALRLAGSARTLAPERAMALVEHADARVPVALAWNPALRLNHYSWRVTAAALTHRAAREMTEGGVQWTPLVDALHARDAWGWQEAYTEYGYTQSTRSRRRQAWDAPPGPRPGPADPFVRAHAASRSPGRIEDRLLAVRVWLGTATPEAAERLLGFRSPMLHVAVGHGLPGEWSGERLGALVARSPWVLQGLVDGLEGVVAASAGYAGMRVADVRLRHPTLSDVPRPEGDRVVVQALVAQQLDAWDARAWRRDPLTSLNAREALVWTLSRAGMVTEARVWPSFARYLGRLVAARQHGAFWGAMARLRTEAMTVEQVDTVATLLERAVADGLGDPAPLWMRLATAPAATAALLCRVVAASRSRHVRTAVAAHPAAAHPDVVARLAHSTHAPILVGVAPHATPDQFGRMFGTLAQADAEQALSTLERRMAHRGAEPEPAMPVGALAPVLQHASRETRLRALRVAGAMRRPAPAPTGPPPRAGASQV